MCRCPSGRWSTRMRCGARWRRGSDFHSRRRIPRHCEHPAVHGADHLTPRQAETQRITAGVERHDSPGVRHRGIGVGACSGDDGRPSRVVRVAERRDGDDLPGATGRGGEDQRFPPRRHQSRQRGVPRGGQRHDRGRLAMVRNCRSDGEQDQPRQGDGAGATGPAGRGSSRSRRKRRSHRPPHRCGRNMGDLLADVNGQMQNRSTKQASVEVLVGCDDLGPAALSV